MRRILMTAAGAAAIAVMAASGGGIASASPHATPTRPRPAPASRAAPMSRPAAINLHRAYEKALPHVKTPNVAAIRPFGPRPRAAGRASNAPPICSPGFNCTMPYHGGTVQEHPHVYLLLWGPDWSAVPSEAATARAMEALLNGLGLQPVDSWSRVLSAYNDTSFGFPSFLSPVYMGAWNDTSAPSYRATQAQIAAEADAFASSRGISGNQDVQVVVATQAGTCPLGFATSEFRSAPRRADPGSAPIHGPPLPPSDKCRFGVARVQLGPYARREQRGEHVRRRLPPTPHRQQPEETRRPCSAPRSASR